MRTDCVAHLRSRVRKTLSEQRLEHCERTEETAVRLCVHFGLAAGENDCGNDCLYCCAAAGLCHDLARELPENRMLDYASRYAPLTEWEKRSPLLAHGKAAAFMVREELGIDRRDVLEAVRTHTVAEPGMSDCGKIVYIADFIEPGRTHIKRDFLQDRERLSLDCLLLEVLERTLRYLRDRRRRIAEPSLVLYEELSGRVFDYGAEDEA